MTDFLDKACACSECTALAQNEEEHDWPAICAAEGHVTGPHAFRCFRCFKLCSEIEAEATFPSSPLGQTDALGHDRDEAERNRRDAVMLPDQGWATPRNSQTCSLCSAVHGRWSKVHCTNVTDKEPCKGGW